MVLRCILVFFCVVYYRIACYYESKGGDLEGKMFCGGGEEEEWKEGSRTDKGC